MSTEKFKEQLESITSQLTQVKGSLDVCNQLVEDGIVAIVSAKKLENEGDKPISLTVTTAELIEKVLTPLKYELDNRKDRLLAAKEVVLANLEEELVPKEEGPAEKEEVVKEDPAT